MPKIPNYRWAEKRMKPCPFCGCTRIRILPQALLPGMSKGFGYWMVRCWHCNVRKMVITNYQRQLVVEWNYRGTEIWSPP